ncbi:uncharacterized protein ACRADG_009192 isoform 2-T2 [Cochliomyia hominivorax]
MDHDSPLSSKVAMFNQHVNQHKQSQLLNPFSNPDGRASPKPTFSKDEYGKPLAGSLTEMRGQKANMHVLKEMLELCQIIDSEGYDVKDEPTMRVIPFGELFNIYNYISDKVVGILLRARKHKLVEFEGEMLFQRRDDDVPIFLIKPIHEIRREMNDKIESIKRSGSASPQATSVLLDKKAQGLGVPRGATPVSRTPSPESSKAGTPVRETKAKPAATPAPEPTPATTEKPAETPKIQISEGAAEATKPEQVVENKPVAETQVPQEAIAQENPQVTEAKKEEISKTDETPEIKTDVNNNNNNNNNMTEINDNLPTVVIEATAVYERPAQTASSESNSSAPTETAASA